MSCQGENHRLVKDVEAAATLDLAEAPAAVSRQIDEELLRQFGEAAAWHAGVAFTRRTKGIDVLF
jgi:hypothetical protein